MKSLQQLLSLLDESQRKALTVLASNDGGAVFHKVGSGKTRIALVWFAIIAKLYKVRFPNGLSPIFLVVCRRKAFQDWQEELTLLGLRWSSCDYENWIPRKRTQPHVFLVSQGMLSKLADDIAEYGETISAIALDEGFLFKNPSSAVSKAAHKVAEASAGPAAVLSGSVMTARNLEDVYGQLKAIRKHEVLGRTLTDFRSSFQLRLRIGGDSGFFKQINQRGSAQRIRGLIAGFTSFHFPPSERKARHIVRSIEPESKQRELLTNLKQNYLLDQDGMKLDIKSVPALMIKCQQISDGFLKGSDDDYLEFPSAKLEYLYEKITEILDSGQRVIVWCAFRQSVSYVLQRLQKAKIKAYGFVGGKTFDVAGWRTYGQVAVATVDSGSSVNHFADVQYAIYYSMSWKWLSLQQSRGRTDRKSSRHQTCFYYYLETKGSLDSRIRSVANRSGDEEQMLIEIKSWLGTN